ncbi:exonuclease SbcCD subunit D [Dubosiella newyorkensis]|jgi:exonuclease SbcD|uniref:exonuclease SbcCD subunit D n=1 Tax=Dubosiella newyorkensis TaxID=1862672 RepID=UPI0023547296|nr:exonuclease SbcCD subunit D [Dubosiella newyorkensis]MCI9041136.1 exonuclease SbcCD subunit D [Dubosiella newyorkensis]
MRLLHLSDLHLGKQVHGYSMQEEQEAMLDRVLDLIDSQKVDGLLIAGDIYDRSTPSEWAMQLFDRFLAKLSERGIETCIIAGNHDSANRLKYGDWLFQKHKIHIAARFDGHVDRLQLEKNGQKIHIYMLPFLKKAYVRKLDPACSSDEEAVCYALGTIDLDPEAFNILMAHQFVEGSQRCDSEQKSVGGSDGIQASVFEPFDYVALGHLHSPQSVTEKIRYAGTLLKYSVDEIHQKKRALLLDICDKKIEVHEIEVPALHDFVEIEGDYMTLSSKTFYQDLNKEDYYSIVLLDEHDIPYVRKKLETIYPKILKITYKNRRQGKLETRSVQEMEAIDPLALIASFYQEQNGNAISEEQKKIIKDLWEETI